MSREQLTLSLSTTERENGTDVLARVYGVQRGRYGSLIVARYHSPQTVTLSDPESLLSFTLDAAAMVTYYL